MLTHPRLALVVIKGCHATVCLNEMLERIKRLFHLVPRPVNTRSSVSKCTAASAVGIKGRPGEDAFRKALGWILTL